MNIPLVVAVKLLHVDWHGGAIRIFAAYRCQCARNCTGDSYQRETQELAIHFT
jgi:hypothetical protein